MRKKLIPVVELTEDSMNQKELNMIWEDIYQKQFAEILRMVERQWETDAIAEIPSDDCFLL